MESRPARALLRIRGERHRNRIGLRGDRRFKNGSVQPLALRLPIRCFLSGRIQPMAIERNTKQLCAEITYTKKYVNAPADRRGNNLCFVVKCDANGEFKFSGLPVGNAHLAIGELKGAIDGQVSGVMPGDSLGSTLHEMDLVVRDGDRISIQSRTGSRRTCRRLATRIPPPFFISRATRNPAPAQAPFASNNTASAP